MVWFITPLPSFFILYSQLDVLQFVTILLHFIIPILYLASHVYVHGADSSGRNERVTDGSEVWMEADLRSEERSRRTLHWFVDRRQQSIYLSNLPRSIQFGVCMTVLDYYYVDTCIWLLDKLE